MSTSYIAPQQGDLGARLRQLRAGQGLSVRELARRAGCSASLVSQVERGLTTPSAGIVYSLANELGVSLDQLFGASGTSDSSESQPATTDASQRRSDEIPQTTSSHSFPARPSDRISSSTQTWGRATGEEGEGILQRAGDRSVIPLSTGIRWERLTPNQDRRVDFLEVVYEPFGKSSESNQAVRHDGREYLLVLEGEIDAVIGFDTLRLGVGDSLAFDPHTPHQYLNPTGKQARCLSVVVHDEPQTT